MTEPSATGAAVMDLRGDPLERGSAEQRRAELMRRIENLRATVAGLSFDLDAPGSRQAREERTALLRHLDDYLLPRLRRMDAPLLAVVGGSTGAGKSTLVNSLVRREVSRSGVLRPTTRSPVLVHHPYDSGAFLSQRILPGLGRVTSEAPEPMQPIDVDAPRITAIRLVPDDGVAPGLGILDAPDIDSVVDTNRDLAVQLLSAADLWVFVTTAARYADDLPWKMLRQAVDRGTAVAIVLDRVPPASLQEVRMHLATLLRDRGLAGAPMFTLPETTLQGGFLPAELVQPLLTWLTALARDPSTRDVVAQRTLARAIDHLPARAETLADWADHQQEAEARLLLGLEEAFRTARAGIRDRLADGSLVRGEVLARWQDLVASGEFFAALEPGRSRSRATAAAGPISGALGGALAGAVAAAVRAHALDAARATVGSWRSLRAGAALVADGAEPRLDSLSEAFGDRLSGAVREWAAESAARLSAAKESAAQVSAAEVSTAGESTAGESKAGESGAGNPKAGESPSGGSPSGTPTAEGDGIAVLARLLALGGPPSPGQDDPLAVGRTVFAARLGADQAQLVPDDLREALRRRLDGVLDEEEARFLERLDASEARAVKADTLRSVARSIREQAR